MHNGMIHGMSWKERWGFIMDGDEVAMVFVRPHAESLRESLGASTPIEKKRLVGFKRVNLHVGESQTIAFEIKATDLAMVDEDGHTSLHNGNFDIVLSRGHGDELEAPASVAVRSPVRLKTFRQWW